MSSSPRMSCQKLGAHSIELTVKLVWSALMTERLAGDIWVQEELRMVISWKRVMSSPVLRALGNPSKISGCKDTKGLDLYKATSASCSPISPQICSRERLFAGVRMVV